MSSASNSFLTDSSKTVKATAGISSLQ